MYIFQITTPKVLQDVDKSSKRGEKPGKKKHNKEEEQNPPRPYHMQSAPSKQGLGNLKFRYLEVIPTRAISDDYHHAPSNAVGSFWTPQSPQTPHWSTNKLN